MKLRHFLDLPFLSGYPTNNMEESHSVLKFTLKGGDVKSSIKRSFRNLDSEYFDFTEDNHFCWYAPITRLLSFKVSKIFVISQHRVRNIHILLKFNCKGVVLSESVLTCII